MMNYSSRTMCAYERPSHFGAPPVYRPVRWFVVLAVLAPVILFALEMGLGCAQLVRMIVSGE